MNIKLDQFKKEIIKKKVACLGVGISNAPLISYLSDLGVDVTAFDKSNEENLKDTIEKLKGKNVKFVLGKDYLKKLRGFDVIFRSPGIKYDIPELIYARENGAVVTSEMEEFFNICPAKIFAVTGSDGKTTTTTLIYNMLKEQGYKCWLGGNIGMPLLDKIDEISADDMVVLELSSFQLQTMKKSPDISVVTNITPNHLDYHKSMEEYIEAKKNIYIFQSEGNKLVLNLDNNITKGFIGQGKGDSVFFSRISNVDKGVFLNGESIVIKDGEKETKVISTKDIIIPGVHNVENYLAAICAVFDYVKISTIHKVATSFKGVDHRIELVREFDGIKFYNDSIASSPTRTIAGLNSFEQKVILIAGGYDKKISYDVMGKTIKEKVKCLILIGQTGHKIEEALNKEMALSGKEDIPVVKCDSLESAVKNAYKNAKSGDIVILSPASASFDMFKNFEERGNKFKELVNKIETGDGSSSHPKA